MADRSPGGLGRRLPIRTGHFLVVLGVLLAIAHVALVPTVVPGPLWAEVTMASFPIVVALSVVWLGRRIDRSGAITRTTRSSFRRWFLLGVGGQVFLSIWIALMAAFLPPYGFVPPQYAVPTAMTVAVLYGTLLGYYQAQAKQRTEALRDRERELSTQNERLESFTSVVSHDLRNPLNVAQARIRQLPERETDEKLAAIDRSLDRMAALIEDLLALARSGGTVADTEAVSLSAAARRAWEGVETASATLSIEGDVTFPADSGRLQQVFENLYRNSVEHGDPDVTVRVGPLPDGFYVEDSGPGVPEEDREEVFDFGVTSRSEGTGFGLAIVSAIAEAHGWDVALVEGSDGGARFEFTGVEVRDSSESTPPAASSSPA